ncbi:MAG: DUF6585 family protein [Pseudomonadota bacterium]
MNEDMSHPGSSYFGSRRKAGLASAGCSAFVVLGYWFTKSGDTFRHSAEYYNVLGWITIIAGSLFGLAWLASFIMPHRLVIEESGFSYKRALSKLKHFRWDDIEEIWVFSRHGSGIVVWKNKRDTGSITRALSGHDGWLPGGWEMSPEELACELRSAKERHDMEMQSAV